MFFVFLICIRWKNLHTWFVCINDRKYAASNYSNDIAKSIISQAFIWNMLVKIISDMALNLSNHLEYFQNIFVYILLMKFIIRITFNYMQIFIKFILIHDHFLCCYCCLFVGTRFRLSHLCSKINVCKENDTKFVLALFWIMRI